MYATTREAFVVMVGHLLEALGGDVRQLNMRTLSVPGTHGKVVDQESCCQRLDQDFANKVMDAVEAILKKKAG
jgi:hypothetical protein